MVLLQLQELINSIIDQLPEPTWSMLQFQELINSIMDQLTEPTWFAPVTRTH